MTYVMPTPSVACRICWWNESGRCFKRFPGEEKIVVPDNVPFNERHLSWPYPTHTRRQTCSSLMKEDIASKAERRSFHPSYLTGRLPEGWEVPAWWRWVKGVEETVEEMLTERDKAINLLRNELYWARRNMLPPKISVSAVDETKTATTTGLPAGLCNLEFD